MSLTPKNNICCISRENAIKIKIDLWLFLQHDFHNLFSKVLNHVSFNSFYRTWMCVCHCFYDDKLHFELPFDKYLQEKLFVDFQYQRKKLTENAFRNTSNWTMPSIVSPAKHKVPLRCLFCLFKTVDSEACTMARRWFERSVVDASAFALGSVESSDLICFLHTTFSNDDDCDSIL